MAKPIQFPEQNGAIGDAPVYRDGARTITCHALTPNELMEIVNTGKIWVIAMGNAPAVVDVVGSHPFDKTVN